MSRQQRSTLYQAEKERLWKRGKRFLFYCHSWPYSPLFEDKVELFSLCTGPCKYYSIFTCHFCLVLLPVSGKKKGVTVNARDSIRFLPSVLLKFVVTSPKLFRRYLVGTAPSTRGSKLGGGERGWGREICPVTKTWLEFLVRSSCVCGMFSQALTVRQDWPGQDTGGIPDRNHKARFQEMRLCSHGPAILRDRL